MKIFDLCLMFQTNIFGAHYKVAYGDGGGSGSCAGGVWGSNLSGGVLHAARHPRRTAITLTNPCSEYPS